MPIKSIANGASWKAFEDEPGVERRQRAGRNIEYRARITVDDNGGRRQLTRKAKSRSGARIAKTDLLVEWKMGTEEKEKKADPKLVTFAQLADEYAAEHIVTPVYDNPDSDDRNKQAGIVGVRDGERAMKLFKDAFGADLVSDIKKHAIKKWKTARLKTPKQRGGGQRSLASVNGELRFLYGAFRFAIDSGYIDQNPCRGLIDQKNENKRTRVLTRDEENRLLESAIPSLKLILIFLLDTGMRLGEARQAERRDLNLKKGLITLRKRTTKAKAKREIPILSPRVREVIDERLAAIASDPNALLFPENYYFYEYRFQAAANRVGVKNVMLHDCRRTWASRAVASGMPIAEVMKYGGWSTKEDLEMLLRYLNPTEETNRVNAGLYTAYLAQGQTAANNQTTATEMIQ